jgi:hypothetical protein
MVAGLTVEMSPEIAAAILHGADAASRCKGLR